MSETVRLCGDDQVLRDCIPFLRCLVEQNSLWCPNMSVIFDGVLHAYGGGYTRVVGVEPGCRERCAGAGYRNGGSLGTAGGPLSTLRDPAEDKRVEDEYFLTLKRQTPTLSKGRCWL